MAARNGKKLDLKLAFALRLGLEFLLAAYVPFFKFMHSPETSLEGYPTNQRTLRTKSLALTFRAFLHCRTGRSWYEVHDRRTRGFRTLHRWERVTVLKVTHCRI